MRRNIKNLTVVVVEVNAADKYSSTLVDSVVSLTPTLRYPPKCFCEYRRESVNPSPYFPACSPALDSLVRRIHTWRSEAVTGGGGGALER